MTKYHIFYPLRKFTRSNKVLTNLLYLTLPYVSLPFLTLCPPPLLHVPLPPHPPPLHRVPQTLERLPLPSHQTRHPPLPRLPPRGPHVPRSQTRPRGLARRGGHPAPLPPFPRRAPLLFPEPLAPRRPHRGPCPAAIP